MVSFSFSTALHVQTNPICIYWNQHRSRSLSKYFQEETLCGLMTTINNNFIGFIPICRRINETHFVNHILVEPYTFRAFYSFKIHTLIHTSTAISFENDIQFNLIILLKKRTCSSFGRSDWVHLQTINVYWNNLPIFRLSSTQFAVCNI